MKHTKVKIDELKNEIIDNNNINYIIDNFIIICNYNSNLHILSYQYLSSHDTKYIYTLIIISFFSGIVELINFNANLSIYITLLVGINNLILGIVFNRYKELKLSATAQTHYQYYNSFEKLKLRINMNNDIQNSNAFLYKNIHSFIKQINDEITMLFTTRPNFPSNILNEYQINKPDISINNRNQVMYNRKKSILFSINKSFNFIDMAPINENDKEEYENFMKSIKQKNIDKIQGRNENLIHFK
jgi:hypothetical protein